MMLKFERKPYQGFNLKGRLKALGVHLSISIVIFVVFVFFMLRYWYPMPHFLMNGGWQGIRIMLMIDIVIGPCLTFLLYNNRKGVKELRFDLGLIVIIQSCLLAFGVHAVYQQRPVTQVLTNNGYIATLVKEDLVYDPIKYPHPFAFIREMNVKKVYPPLLFAENPDWKSPKQYKYPYADLFKPAVSDDQETSLSPEKYMNHYTTLNSPYFLSSIDTVVELARTRLDSDPKAKESIKAYEAKHGVGKYYYFGLKGEYGEAIVVYSKDFKQVDYFDFELYD